MASEGSPRTEDSVSEFHVARGGNAMASYRGTRKATLPQPRGSHSPSPRNTSQVSGGAFRHGGPMPCFTDKQEREETVASQVALPSRQQRPAAMTSRQRLHR